MQKIKVKNTVEKIVITFYILWGAASFFLFPTIEVAGWVTAILSLVGIILLFFNKSPYFLLILTTYVLSYSFYGIMFTYGLPVWVVMVAMMLLLGSSFVVLGRKIIPVSSNFQMLTVFYVISVLEVYLALSFWLINPLTRSLIIIVFCYLFFGFISSVLEEKIDRSKLSPYIYIAALIFLSIIFTVSWGR